MPHQLLRLMICTSLAIVLTGCSTSRYDELRAQSNKVERALEGERDQTLRAAKESPNSAWTTEKLNHLTSLRYSLIGADLGLAATRTLIPEADRPLAYDALEQAYDTIEWNIPLLPGQGTKPMPDAFTGGAFDFDRFIAPTP